MAVKAPTASEINLWQRSRDTKVIEMRSNQLVKHFHWKCFWDRPTRCSRGISSISFTATFVCVSWQQDSENMYWEVAIKGILIILCHQEQQSDKVVRYLGQLFEFWEVITTAEVSYQLLAICSWKSIIPNFMCPHISMMLLTPNYLY
jgi:hypothetical protein